MGHSTHSHSNIEAAGGCPSLFGYSHLLGGLAVVQAEFVRAPLAC